MEEMKNLDMIQMPGEGAGYRANEQELCPGSDLVIVHESDNESDSWDEQSVRVNLADCSQGSIPDSLADLKNRKHLQLPPTPCKFDNKDYSPRGDLNPEQRRRRSIADFQESRKESKDEDETGAQLQRIQSQQFKQGRSTGDFIDGDKIRKDLEEE